VYIIEEHSRIFLQVYQEQGLKDKERYKKEIEDYRKRLLRTQELSDEDSGDPKGEEPAALEASNGDLQQEPGEAIPCSPAAGNADEKSDNGDDDDDNHDNNDGGGGGDDDDSNVRS
jgi:hypothetical protein